MRAPASGWTRKLIWPAIRMAWWATVGMAATLWGRLTGNRAHPRWSMLVEWVARTLKIAVRAGLGSMEVVRLLPPSMVPPALRGEVVHGHGELAGMPFESFSPIGWTETGKTCLYLHGGGYVTCAPATHRGFIAELAVHTGMRCIAIDYRLAPEDPYPCALDDANRAIEALATEGVATGDLWVGGDSAGGGLTLAVMLRRRSLGQSQPAGGIVLSPWVDLKGSGETIVTNAKYDYLPVPLLHTFSDYYRGQEAIDHPEVSPMYAELSGLPPLLMLTGGAEVFASENRTFAANARRDGVSIEHHEEPDMIHVYPAVLPFTPQARAALSRIGAFVRAAACDAKKLRSRVSASSPQS